ncbi:MAG: hypothetical protein GF331_12245 [Chitinivibrionales bacterium]|nr:hypothetical protein [Chitinivibrionales bacterium]
MNCRFVREHLLDIVERRLEPATLDTCMRHRAECTDCAQLLTRAEAAWNEWDPAAPVQASPEFVARILDRAESQTPLRRLMRTLSANWHVALQPVAATLLLAGAVWFGGYLGGAGSAQVDDQVSSAPGSYYDVLTAYPSGSVADFYRPDTDIDERGEQ